MSDVFAGEVTEVKSIEDAPIKLPKAKKTSAKKAVKEPAKFGNQEIFQLLSQTGDNTVEAMEIPDVGCVLNRNGVLLFVPRTRIVKTNDSNGVTTGRYLKGF